jgi:SpoVK/Ycf46/Vps4 family AAA+-type ATPase
MNGDAVQLICVEVCPLFWQPQTTTNHSKHHHQQHAAQAITAATSTGDTGLNAAMVKLELMEISLLQSEEHNAFLLYIQFDHKPQDETPQQQQQPSASCCSVGTLCYYQDSLQEPSSDDTTTTTTTHILYLRSSHPLSYDRIPCQCRAFTRKVHRNSTNKTTTQRATVTEATMVRIILPTNTDSFHSRLTGELPEQQLSLREMEETLQNHNPETIRQLTLRLQAILQRIVHVGTTEDALLRQQSSQARSNNMKEALQQYLNCKNVPTMTQNQSKEYSRRRSFSLFEDGSIIVHSPYHGAGKTRLVATLAHQIGCQRIHIIRSGPLLAKFGIHVDAALETIVHEITLSAALGNESLCIILDQLDGMMPPSMSNKTAAATAAGDAAVPALNGMASLLMNLSKSLKEKQEMPFPKRSHLYNINGNHGSVLPVHVCLVGIVTCPDDGFKREGSSSSFGRSILESMVAGRYRVPDLTAGTRLSALQYALRKESIKLDKELEEKLPFLAASAVWLKGGLFAKVARRLDRLRRTKDCPSQSITHQDLVSVLANLSKTSASSSTAATISTIEFNAQSTSNGFDSIGGNDEAKKTLCESLMLDPVKHKIFIRLGLKPPTGVLLYGSPGTGKTLMAKAVANILRSHSASALGGAFVSISSTDIVCAEVGSGEKMLVASFATARANAPAVVFIDEFQALFVERSRAGSGRLSATLLHCMDDLAKRRDLDLEQQDDALKHGSDRVLVLAATNTPWMIDKAFLRPGRFDRTVYVALPSFEERKAILRLRIGKMKHNLADDNAMIALCSRLSEDTDGFSGADLVSLCRAAAIEALRDGNSFVRADDYDKALLDTRASTSKSTLNRLERWSY